MAEQHHQSPTDAMKSHLPENGPSTSQVLAVVTLFPVGAALLCLGGLTLASTLIGLAFSAPLFLIFSPVIVPAILTIALTVAGFLTSGVFGLTALSSVSWIISYFRRMRGSWAEQIGQARWRVEDTAGQVGQWARETGQRP